MENKGSVENTGSRFFTQEKELCYPSEFLFDLPRCGMQRVRLRPSALRVKKKEMLPLHIF